MTFEEVVLSFVVPNIVVFSHIAGVETSRGHVPYSGCFAQLRVSGDDCLSRRTSCLKGSKGERIMGETMLSSLCVLF